MEKKQVTIMVSRDINDRWAEAAKKLHMTKSGMVEELLRELLPVVEQETMQGVLAKALRQVGDGLKEVSNELGNSKKK